MQRTYVLLNLIALIGFGLLATWWLTQTTVTAAHCAISGQPNNCPEAVISATKQVLGTNLFSNTTQIAHLQTLMPAGYQVVGLAKTLSGEITVTIKQQPVIFVVRAANETVQVGRDGSLFGMQADSPEQQQNTDLFTITTKHSLSTLTTQQGTLKPDILQQLSPLALLLYKQEHLFHNGEWISPEELRLHSDQLTVILGGQESAAQAYKALQVINSLENTNDTSIGEQTREQASELDMRFRLPVLRSAQ